MTGLAHYSTLKVDNPVSVAIASGGESLKWLLPWVNLGAIAGLSTVILVSLYGQTRIFYAMSRDGFLPATFARVHPKYNTPAQSTLVIGVFVALIAGIFPLNVLGELVSVGTLLAFMFVCTAVIILRETRPKVRRPFRVPFYPLTPILGILVCGAMVYPLLEESWLRLVGWLAIGVVIYVIYGARHAKKPTWSLDDAPEEKS
jgi:APA family basic amino acid/polyamine antiporter